MAQRITAASIGSDDPSPGGPGIVSGDRWCVVPVAWGVTQSIEAVDLAERVQRVLDERSGVPRGSEVPRGYVGTWPGRLSWLADRFAGDGEPVPGSAVRKRAVEALEAVRTPSGTGFGGSGASAGVLGRSERSGGLVEVLEIWPWGSGDAAVVEDRPWAAGLDLGGCLAVRWRSVRPGVWGHPAWWLGSTGEPVWAGDPVARLRMYAVTGESGMVHAVPLAADWDDVSGYLPPRQGAAAWLVPCPDSSQRVTGWAFAWRVARGSRGTSHG